MMPDWLRDLIGGLLLTFGGIWYVAAYHADDLRRFAAWLGVAE